MSNLLVCVDFDRTLCSEAVVDAIMERACRAAGLDVDAIQNTKQAAESRGESFSTLEYLQQQQSEATVNEVKRQFTAIAQKHSPLYEDSLPLLQSLRERSIPHLILTQGLNEWQELKIIASKLHEFPYKIITEKEKGKEIKRWRKADGSYLVPVAGFAPAGSVILIDDKAKSFTGLPSDCRGFLIRRPNEQVLPSQAGELHHNVTIVASLRVVADKLPSNKAGS